MKRAVLTFALCLVITGCGNEGMPFGDKTAKPRVKKLAVPLETVEVASDDPLYYLPIVDATASSFDQTPDWAPDPNPMAPIDGDMLTRWSSDYEEKEPWIRFDLGKKSVVSEVIIRWERAHATKYLIQVSDDDTKWKEVFREDNNKGGDMRSVFPPVECRYVRVLGKEKVKDQWGISIWEIEIYGPQSFNPQANISQKDYLSKMDETDKKKEVEALIRQLSSPVVPISEDPFQRGVVFTSWTSEELSSASSDFALARLKETGFDTVAIMVPAYQETLNSDTVFVNDAPGGDTPDKASLEHAIDTCHKLGMRVMIKVHVDPRTDEARINIIPSEKWFDSYEKLILDYAVFSEKNKVEVFSIGTELEATTFDAWEHRWKSVIEKVRGVYKGSLTYSANWTEYKGVPFWHELDFVGIDAYFPLTNEDDPTLENLTAAWNKHADDIEAWLNEQGLIDKGVVFTEIGYTSTNGTNRQPWVPISNKEDQKEQADCFRATFDALSKRPWFKGYEIWQYMPQERWSPLGFTVTGKESEGVVKEWAKLFSNKHKGGR